MSILQQLFSELRGYKVLTALLSQSGTDAPTLTILKNDTGLNPSLEFIANGSFKIDFGGQLDVNKTWYVMNPIGDTLQASSGSGYGRLEFESGNLYVKSYEAYQTTDGYNEVLIKTPIEIRIYA